LTDKYIGNLAAIVEGFRNPTGNTASLLTGKRLIEIPAYPQKQKDRIAGYPAIAIRWKSCLLHR
jgi:hypothetical protein